MIRCYQPIDYNSIMKNRVVLLTGYLGQLAKATTKLLKKHGAEVYNLANPDEAIKTSTIDSLIYFSKPVRHHSVEEINEDLTRELGNDCQDLHRWVRLILPQMKRQREGTLVAVTSDYAVTGIPYVALKSAGDAAINAYVRSVAVECSKFGVRANSVITGFSIAENGDNFAALHGHEKARDAFRHYQPIERRGTSEDVANCVLFCASPLSNFITGEVFPVNGGVLAVGHSQIWNQPNV